MTTLSQWFARKAKWPLIIYAVVAFAIQMFFLFYTISDHENQIERRIRSQVKNVVAVGIAQHNREVIESSMSVIVDELGAKSILLCDGELLLFGYPQKTTYCSSMHSEWFEKAVVEFIEGTSFSVHVALPRLNVPWSYSYLNLFVAVFLIFGLFLIYRMQDSVAKDLLVPLSEAVFGESELTILELEDIRRDHLEKKQLENERIVNQTALKIAKQVAHDIQSPLGALSVAKNSYNKNPDMSDKLMGRAIDRINDIIEDLGQKHSGIKKIEGIELNLILEEIVAEKLIEYASLELRIKLPELKEKVLVVGNKVILLRILSNLINNAVEAHHGKERRPEISLEVKVRGRWVLLVIVDNGQGISSEDLKKVTEYGFTKGKKLGSGTGLTYAKEKIKEFGGELTISSEVDLGTSVSLFLLRV